jgi:hypothetical protein
MEREATSMKSAVQQIDSPMWIMIDCELMDTARVSGQFLFGIQFATGALCSVAYIIKDHHPHSYMMTVKLLPLP